MKLLFGRNFLPAPKRLMWLFSAVVVYGFGALFLIALLLEILRRIERML